MNHIKQWLLCAAALLAIAGFIGVGNVFAETVIYGPEVFTRMAGSPSKTKHEFIAPDTSGSFELIVRNGEGDWGRISSAVITLNGTQVLGPNAFNQGAGTIVVPVQLQPTNDLSVELRSAPGNSIQVSIVSSEDLKKMGEINGIGIKADGSPVANAQVTVQFPATGESFQTTTSDAGVFKFTNVPKAGNFITTIDSIDGYTGSSSSFVTDESHVANVTVIVSVPGSGNIFGTVYLSNGMPAPNAVVSVNFMETDYVATVVTSTNGTYQISGVPPDGSLVLTAFDPVSAAHGSLISYLTPSHSQRTFNLFISAPQNINPYFINGDFANGTLDGWTTEGDVQIIPKSSAFPSGVSAMTANPYQTSLVSAFATAGEECAPAPFSALVTTAGDDNAVGQLSQTFKVGPGQDTLTGRIRFVSDEWPQWYGTQFNDSYVVTLITPGGTKVLAKGNLNSSVWGEGIYGFNGAVEEISVSADVSAFVGKTVTLSIKVSDVGDKIIDSGVVVSDFKIVDKNARNYHSSGSWTSDTKVSGQFGQVVWITVNNVNWLGTGISISSNKGQYKESHLLPYLPVTFQFSTFSAEPISWQFDVSAKADAFVVTYTIESTWIPGMPPNPCP
ncbi:carboxypeptidase-like regulatory domain-containing protein [Geoalkalibacter halelectricus]|uniref:Carboxypeptidase-like regulatory domain-containing protein n=1 Tax=Geoalkalibacter halelectricus TaxID=2847045 RepID=A0ABY5ZKD5_9BACT|nr:carboxypeptidase-like regulatory domain-containing protein [Geoalkalibacter halelectricus]MDO3377154.1 carboxypeptidase-like regulatory domain-containing protein [Geoalkalibacter halelectricus]UWZ79632.1 carboxypeptidase-like regulatory domain-containing protein [Geoalkalibacter halelectricus]